LSLAAEKPGLAEPFTGITTNGRIEAGRFGIRSTGVSTAPVRKAAETFLAGLTPAQREKTLFAVDDVEWRKWMNQSFYVRQGRGTAQEGDPQILEDRQRESDRSLEGNVVLDCAGVSAKELSAAQPQQLLDLIALYIDNMDDGHARVKMDEVRAFLDRTWLAWIGDTRPGSVFYYRIHSPVVLIEFDHQEPVGLRHLMKPGVPNVEHIHTVVRTPNGNDYGKDLLRQHYERHPHPSKQ
jgi:hypothetical protein